MLQINWFGPAGTPGPTVFIEALPVQEAKILEFF